jgi:hypothetical protein
LVVYYFSDEKENRSYVVIQYVLEEKSGVRVRNSIYVDKHTWISEQGSRDKPKEEELDHEQARIARHLAERGAGLAKKDFRKVTKEEFDTKTSLASH